MIKGKTQIHEGELHEIRVLLVEGYTIPKIAERLGCSKSTLYRLFQNNGVFYKEKKFQHIGGRKGNREKDYVLRVDGNDESMKIPTDFSGNSFQRRQTSNIQQNNNYKYIQLSLIIDPENDSDGSRHMKYLWKIKVAFDFRFYKDISPHYAKKTSPQHLRYKNLEFALGSRRIFLFLRLSKSKIPFVQGNL